MSKKKFTYKKSEWDDVRPTLLKSTGLGAALKSYEAEKKSLITKPSLESYAEAVKALEAVEKVRLSTITACGAKHEDAQKFLKLADPKAERGLLVALFGNKVISQLDAVEPEIAKLMARYENRVNVLESGLPQFKSNFESDTPIDPLIASSVKALVNEPDGSFATPPTSPALDSVLGVAAKAQVLKKNEDLAAVVARCEEIAARLGRIPELHKQAGKLIKRIKPYVKNQGIDDPTEKK